MPGKTKCVADVMSGTHRHKYMTICTADVSKTQSEILGTSWPPRGNASLGNGDSEGQSAIICDWYTGKWSYRHKSPRVCQITLTHYMSLMARSCIAIGWWYHHPWGRRYVRACMRHIRVNRRWNAVQYLLYDIQHTRDRKTIVFVQAGKTIRLI